MLRGTVRALLKHSTRCAKSPIFTAVRGARTRPAAAVRKNGHALPTPEPQQVGHGTTTIPRDLDEALEDFNEKEVIELEVDPALLLLEHMNMSRPGTKTDKRYRKQKNLIKMLTSETEKTQSLFAFFLEEAKREIMYYPNRDEFESTNSKTKQSDLERDLEFELKRTTLSQWNVTNERYKRLQVLLTVLENLFKRQDGALVLPVDQMAQCFELAQYVMDDELKFRTRFLSGSLIYRLKKVEFDAVNESLFVESLMYYGESHEAQRILMKNASKVDQRWWYEFMIINYIDMRNFNEAENVAKHIQNKFGPEMDERIYIQFINGYMTASNLERVQLWTQRFKDFVKKRGFATSGRQEPGLGATEEETLRYLNRIDPPTRESFLGIITSYCGINEFSNLKALLDSTSQLMDFYLVQRGASIEDLEEVLIDFKFEYQTKLRPIFSKLSDSKAEAHFNDFFTNYREQHKVQTKQADILESFFRSLSRTGRFAQIVDEFKTLTETQQRLTQKNMYTLISTLVKNGAIVDAFTVLNNLEESHREILNNPEILEELVIPPVGTHHYIPFVRYYGRSADVDKMFEIIQRFTSTLGQHNPVILTQILSSLDRNKVFDVACQYIHGIILNDIHKQDPQYEDFRQLYSAIWQCLRHLTSPSRSGELVAQLPDLRVVFMKMIYDRAVPSPDDYTTIIKTFALNRDWNAVICVLQYMGLLHKVTPTPQCLNFVEKLYRERKEKAEMLKRNDMYSETRLKLQAESLAKRSLDPFSSQKDPMEEERIIDEMTKRAEPVDLEHELLWKIALAKVVEIASTGERSNELMNDAHAEFELTQNLEELLGPVKAQ